MGLTQLRQEDFNRIFGKSFYTRIGVFITAEKFASVKNIAAQLFAPQRAFAPIAA